jgi:hypothetical protein
VNQLFGSSAANRINYNANRRRVPSVRFAVYYKKKKSEVPGGDVQYARY